MKRFLSIFVTLPASIIALLGSCPAAADDHSYVYVGAELGYVTSSSKSSDDVRTGAAIGPIRLSAEYSYFSFDLTGLGFVKGTPEGGSSKTRLVNMMAIDIALGFPFGPVFVGVAPYAWTWVKDTSDGLGVVAKFHQHVDVLDGTLIVEARAVPVTYFKGYKNEFHWWENGLTAGASWIHDSGLLAGLRYTRLGHENITSLILGWGWAE